MSFFTVELDIDFRLKLYLYYIFTYSRLLSSGTWAVNNFFLLKFELFNFAKEWLNLRCGSYHDKTVAKESLKHHNDNNDNHNDKNPNDSDTNKHNNKKQPVQLSLTNLNYSQQNLYK